VARTNDQVFAVSLSEIAFTLIFVLMLLLGFMLFSERQAKEKAESRLAKTAEAEDAKAATQAMQLAEQQLRQILKEAGIVNPTALAQIIAKSGEAAAERDRLRREAVDMSAKLVALQELRSRVEQAGKNRSEPIIGEEVEQAMELRREVEKMVEEPAVSTKARLTTDQALERIKRSIAAMNELRLQAKQKLGMEVKPGEELKTVQDVVERAGIAAVPAGKNSIAVMKSEIDKLRAQVAFYEKRDKLRGLDHPPCWMDKDSKIQYIFNVQTTPSGFVVTRGWPSDRESDAKASKGFEQMMASAGAPMSNERFSLGAKPYLDFGKAQSPECRHFVYVSSTIENADRRDEARRVVSSYFYISERKTPAKP
jgi:hypothetical protein